MSQEAVRVVDLSKQYRRKDHLIPVLQRASFTVAAGEWVALTGPSGCGKTTLLHLLGLLDKPDEGEIHCFGVAVRHLGAAAQARVRRQQLGFIFQSYQLLPELNAQENVMLPGRLNGLSVRACRERAQELLHQVGMSERALHTPAELSGGEQQRIAIARALINRPRLILADEPTGNLDTRNAEEVMKLLHAMREQQGMTIVMVTHDRAVARHADRLFEMERGTVRAGSRPAAPGA
jgi:ABC-type lipoprotein export system ATPase subunit